MPINPKLLGPCGEALAFSVEIIVSIGARVSHLLAACRPAAVSWLVVSIVVNAVNLFAGGPLTHIGKEVFKRMNPPFANGYSATAVVMVLYAVGVIAPILHGSPRAVCATGVSPLSLMGVAVFRHEPADDFGLQASARLSVSAAKNGGANDGFFPANTKASPPGARFSSINSLQRSEAPEFLPSQINGFWHSDNTNLRFLGIRQS